jgi:S-formylglutathione hydrolase FrmB
MVISDSFTYSTISRLGNFSTTVVVDLQLLPVVASSSAPNSNHTRNLIIGLSVGGGGALVATAVAVVMYRRKRGGFQYQQLK